VQVVSTGSGPLLDWRLVGDEPYLLAQALPDIPVLIGKDRYLSGRYAWDYFAAQVLVLDDGFQHYALHRDLDIVLLDASRPFGCGALLPRGILREPLSALRRAHAVVLTRVEMAATTLPALRQQVEYWVEAPSILAMTTVAEGVWQKDHRQLDEATRLSGCRVVAFAGIGNPRAFATTLQQLGSEIAALVLFPDHYPYTLYDWQVIVDIARQQQATCLVTTEKDAVRLAPSWHAAIPVYALRIGVRWLQGETFFQQQLAAVMAHA
jgi:tetraacyldisaccharide 4'-kinase